MVLLTADLAGISNDDRAQATATFSAVVSVAGTRCQRFTDMSRPLIQIKHPRSGLMIQDAVKPFTCVELLHN